MNKKLFVSVLLCMVLCLCLTAPAFATASGKYIADEVGILTESEKAELNSMADAVANEYGCGVYLCLVKNYRDYVSGTIEDFGEYAYEQLDCGIGEDRNCVLLSMSMYDRDFDILVHGGSALYAFTDYAQDTLAERFLDDFRDNDWVGGFADYFAGCDEILMFAANGTPLDITALDYSSSTASAEEEGYDSSELLVIFGLPCVVALIICKGFQNEMKTAKRKTGAGDYIGDGGISMSIVQDHFLYRRETRVRIQEEKPRSGGGGGTSINSRGFSHRSGKF